MSLELQDLEVGEDLGPEELVENLSQATDGSNAKRCFLKLSQLLEENDLVKDGRIQQATVIRAANTAKDRVPEDEWPEDEYRALLYKFADSADGAEQEVEVKEEVEDRDDTPSDSTEGPANNYSGMELCKSAGRAFLDPLFLILIAFVFFLGNSWIPRAITSRDQLNLYRQLGDLLHLLSFFVLILRLYRQRSAAGISHKTQEMLLATFLLRYTDLFTNFISEYNTVMKIGYIFITLTVVITIRCFEPYKGSHKKTAELDTFPHYAAILLCLIVTLAIEKVFFSRYIHTLQQQGFAAVVQEIGWMWSIYVEMFAVIPQLLILRKKGEIEKYMLTYLFLLGAYRGLYLANWAYRLNHDRDFTMKDNWPMMVAGAVQEIPYAYFLLRIPKWRKWY
jgi:ER lumen protein retaining receptor